MVTVPEHLVEELGWQDGERLLLDADEGRLTLTRLEAEEQEQNKMWDHKDNRPLTGFLTWCHKKVKHQDDESDEWT